MTSLISEPRELNDEQEQRSPRSLHILIIEDVPDDAELTVLALESANISFSYDITDTAIRCQKHLQNKKYDVVLSDYRLPSFNGLQAFEFLKQSQQDIPFILVTGSLGEEAAVECIKLGMTDYVLKDRLFRLPMVLNRALQDFALRQQQKEAIAKIEQQAWRETIINQIVQAMRETLVLSEVLQTTANLLYEALQVSYCLICQPDVCQQMCVTYVTESRFNERDKIIGLPCEFYEYYQNPLMQGLQITIDRATDQSPQAVQQIALKHGIKALIITPLFYQQTYLGGISIYQLDHQRQWSENELLLVKQIANQCAIAIYQAALYENAQAELSERKKMESQLRHDAFHDSLTGLPNRALFLDRLSHALQIYQRRSHVNTNTFSDRATAHVHE